MAIEIDSTYTKESVVIEGDDARRFMDEVITPSTDARRIDHLERSASVADELLTDQTAGDILAGPATE